jgi:hypothetical protein
MIAEAVIRAAWRPPREASGSIPRASYPPIVAFKDDLAKHLNAFPAAPFLFIGSGISRRYLGLPAWEELLRQQAATVGQPYEYYSTSAGGDYPRIASLIARDLHDLWWKDSAFEESRDHYKDQVKGPQSALKVEVARGLVDCLARLPKSGTRASEIAVLKTATIDGVITTNYDPLIEHVFPDFETFVGQDQMLFAHPQGIGEIYKIHGSHEDPDSIVLTEEDFQLFNDRNPYLAAKLLTIFVEHPVFFLGYSLSDPNVSQILHSIASVLTNDRIGELQDRLIFLEWDEGATSPSLVPIPFVTGGYTIPLVRAKVANYVEVFEVLAGLERRFPARILRQLKERVYELVRTNDPKERLYVQDLDADTDAAEVDVVLGVGAIEKLTQSYKGLSRDDLIEDVLGEGTHLVAQRVVDEVLSAFARNWHVPAFKYLREAGLLDDDGTLKDKDSVHDRVAHRVEHIADHLRPPAGYVKRAEAAVDSADKFETLVENEDPLGVLLAVGLLPPEKHDPPALRQFLVDNPPTETDIFYNTQWRRAVCVYDWLRYARRRRALRRRGRVGRADGRARRRQAKKAE